MGGVCLFLLKVKGSDGRNGRRCGKIFVRKNAGAKSGGDPGDPHHHQPGGDYDLQPGRYLFCGTAGRPADGGRRFPGIALVQSAHGAREPVRPGWQQPDLPDDGGAKPQGHQICVRIQHLGRSGGDASLFPGYLVRARLSAEFSGSQPGYLCHAEEYLFWVGG